MMVELSPRTVSENCLRELSGSPQKRPNRNCSLFMVLLGEQAAQKQHFEQNHRINRRTTIVGTVEIFDLASNEVKVNHSIDFTQQVIFGYKHLQCRYRFVCCCALLTCRYPTIIRLLNKKNPRQFGEDFVEFTVFTLLRCQASVGCQRKRRCRKSQGKRLTILPSC